MPKIVRLTLFKLPDSTVIEEAIQKYSTLSQDAQKVRPAYTLNFDNCFNNARAILVNFDDILTPNSYLF